MSLHRDILDSDCAQAAVGSRDTFAELRALAASGFRAGAIYADVPLRFDTYSEKGRDRCADRHYPTMTVDELIAMRPLILALAARDCALISGPRETCSERASKLSTGGALPIRPLASIGSKPGKAAP
jgi:hypothetical protein